VITAASGSVSGSTILTSTAATVQSIVITPNSITTGTGINQQLSATGTYSDGTTQTVTTAANWTSGIPSVATVGPTTGLVTGVSNGSATISATIGSVTGTAPLSVVTDRWVLTGNMTTSHGLALTATLLPNGTVLAAGGEELSNGVSVAISSAEIYDPVAGTWTATGSMEAPRISHTATLLPNGQVLVAGGQSDYYSTLATAEIYNPATGAWHPTGNMSTARYGHTATLLPNGTVLVAGGFTPIPGASTDTEGTTSAEIYDPTAGTWQRTASLPTQLEPGFTATLLPNGTVLVVGGLAFIYDPVAGTWSATGAPSAGGNSSTSTLLPNGMVLTAGGIGSASAGIYNPATSTWTLTGSMTTLRGNAAASLLPDGTVLVAGGSGGSGNGGSAEIYNPATGTWSLTGSMSEGRVAFTATQLPNGTVLAAGGAFDSSSEIFYP
jgi:N-acetylneuraminic acid mutarotase